MGKKWKERTTKLLNGLYSASKSAGTVDVPIAETSGAENSLLPIYVL
jgi:hypothetical protein